MAYGSFRVTAVRSVCPTRMTVWTQTNMNWLDGTWFWVLCKLGVPASLASSIPDQDVPINHRSFTYVPRVPDPTVGLPQSQSRRGAHAPVSSAALLRCQRCGGMRSRTYHWRHYHDPIAYPTIGVCSRRRTGCANAKMLKERSTVDSGTMERSIAELPGWGHVLDPK